MTFRVAHQPSNNKTRCPYRVIVQATGREIDWINQYLDYETVRRLADHTLQSYANELLYFLRWWESVHRTDAIAKDASRNPHCSTMCAEGLQLVPYLNNGVIRCQEYTKIPLDRITQKTS